MRRTPEIPRDVFFGDSREEGQPAPQAQAVRPLEESKVQVTVYLSESTAKRLEVLRFHLFNEHDIKVSKSAIADYAINQIGDDLTPLVEHFGVGER